jgi:hypothetical protein
MREQITPLAELRRNVIAAVLMLGVVVAGTGIVMMLMKVLS